MFFFRSHLVFYMKQKDNKNKLSYIQELIDEWISF